MMTRLGWPVVLYAGDENEAECTELVTCITREEQEAFYGQEGWWRNDFWAGFDWDEAAPATQLFTNRVIAAVQERAQRKDFLLLSMGWPQRTIADALPGLTCVEPGIGYRGILPNSRRVFESYAWMHSLYAEGGADTDGRFMDTVINNYFEIEDFPPSDWQPETEDYVAFLSRWTQRKGTAIAVQATETAGIELRVAGSYRPDECDAQDHINFIGPVGAVERGELLSHARALICPTEYIEPFGGVVVEALLCGTPVITTDWGAFPELFRQGIDGWRCRSMQEFVDGIDLARFADREQIRADAQAKWSTEVIAKQYEQYFERLLTLWVDEPVHCANGTVMCGDGFYAKRIE